MHQLTLRVPDELATQLKAAAGERHDSVNAFAVKVLSAAVDPELAGDERSALRERLARAGLLMTPEPVSTPPSSPHALSSARVAAGRGKPLSELVSEGRRR